MLASSRVPEGECIIWKGFNASGKKHYLLVITWSAHLNGQPQPAYLNLQPERQLCLHNAIPWQNYTARHGCSQIIIIDSLSNCQSGDSSEAVSDGQKEDWTATIQRGNFILKMNLDEMVPVDKSNWWLFQSRARGRRKDFLKILLGIHLTVLRRMHEGLAVHKMWSFCMVLSKKFITFNTLYL